MSTPRNGLEQLTAALADHYRIERELGRGGMAAVYLAHDLRHDRDVALKVLRPELAAILGRERFLAEIRLTAKLDHPHILTLLDSGEAGGHLWYTLPYIRGESLRQKLTRERQLKLADALAIARQVAAALDYAHQHGVIHRDVKPENILLHEGEAMLADFGIALAVTEAAGDRLTETGLSLGTPQYMSPEQATAERQLDARSDVYSLGAVLYEMLAGEPPFTGATGQAVIAKLMTTPPLQLRAIRSTVPEGVDLAVARALAKSPADRFDSPAELSAALTLALEPASAARSRWTGALIAAGTLLLALMAYGLYRARGAPAPVAVTIRRFTTTGIASEPSLSPDGRRVAYLIASRTLAVQPIEGGDPVVLVPTSRFIEQPRWTRDGTAILFWMFRDSLTLAGTWMVPSMGGAPRQVMDDQEAYDAGPDSMVALRYQRPDHELQVVELAGGRVRARYPLPDSVGVASFGGVAWSPDGRLAALSGTGLWTLRLADSSLHRVAPEGAVARWDATGRWLYFLAGSAGSTDLWRVKIDRSSGRPAGRPARVLSVPRVQQFDVGPAGQLVLSEVSSTAKATVAVIAPGHQPRLSDPRDLAIGSANAAQVALSDDGGMVAVARELTGSALGPSQGHLSHHFVVDLIPFAGGSSRTLPPPDVSQFAPRWAPDGRFLTVLRTDSAGDFVTVVSVGDGTARRLGTRQSVPELFRTSGDATWSADGNRVIYIASRSQMVVVDPERGSETTVDIPDTIGTAFMGQVLSPRGDQVAVSTIRRLTDWGELWLVDLATRHWRKLEAPFGNPFPARWAGDGTIYILSDRAIVGPNGNLIADLWAVRPEAGSPRFVGPLPEGTVTVSVSADGRRVACMVTRNVSDILLATDFRP